jgi:hypothetical protein
VRESESVLLSGVNRNDLDNAICILVALSQTAALLGSRAVRRERLIACASEASNITSAALKCGALAASSLNIDFSTLVNDDGGCSRATRAASIGTTLRLAALLRGTVMTSIYLDGIAHQCPSSSRNLSANQKIAKNSC